MITLAALSAATLLTLNLGTLMALKITYKAHQNEREAARQSLVRRKKARAAG